MLTIIVAFSILIVIALLIKKSLTKKQPDGYLSFLKKHPASFRNGKFCSCPHCSANNIISRQVGEGLGTVMNAYCCASCGHELWRSNSKI